ncbi:MAG: hypothetical protein LBS47_01885 [Endomicrobium sp.]|jgi:cell division transport system permease protein|nr:hypothetical protein [Endomicrobium sp.]
MKRIEIFTKAIPYYVDFFSIAFLCVFFVFIINHYCQIKNYALSLLKDCNMIVFFDKNIDENEEELVKIELGNTKVAFVKEYVTATEAYLRAVKKNSFLKSISVPGDVKSIQSYAVVIPTSVIDKKSLMKAKASLEEISGVDEVVFDVSVFERYIDTNNFILSCKKVLFIFLIGVIILFIFKCVFFVIQYGAMRFVKNFFLYSIASILGFIAIWILCIFLKYNLYACGLSILLSMPLSVAVGVTLDSRCYQT